MHSRKQVRIYLVTDLMCPFDSDKQRVQLLRGASLDPG